MTTAEADAAPDGIETAIRQNRRAIARSAPLVALGWGHGHDHRILTIITWNPSPRWKLVLTQGITTSVGAEACARIQSQVPRDQAMATIVHDIHAREDRGDLPLVSLSAHLIPWVGDATCACPNRLHPTTIRRLWPADPDRAWNVTETMLDSDDPSVPQRARAAMDTGWGTGHDAAMATILRSIMLDHQDTSVVVPPEIATAVAGLGIASPSLIATLLTGLATMGTHRCSDSSSTPCTVGGDASRMRWCCASWG
jgi:hypothetical protein